MREVPLSVPLAYVNVMVGTETPGFSVMRPTFAHVFAEADRNRSVVAGNPLHPDCEMLATMSADALVAQWVR